MIYESRRPSFKSPGCSSPGKALLLVPHCPHQMKCRAKKQSYSPVVDHRATSNEVPLAMMLIAAPSRPTIQTSKSGSLSSRGAPVCEVPESLQGLMVIDNPSYCSKIGITSHETTAEGTYGWAEHSSPWVEKKREDNSTVTPRCLWPGAPL